MDSTMDRPGGRSGRSGPARVWTAMVVATLLVALVPGIASAQDFTVELVGELAGRPGETVGAFTGSGCPHAEVGEPPELLQSKVFVGLPFSIPGGLTVALAEPDIDGNFGETDLVVPPEATPGTYELEANCRDSSIGVEVVSLGTLEVLPPLEAPESVTGPLTPAEVVAEPGQRLTFTAPVDVTIEGLQDAFLAGQDITLVLYPGAVVVGSATAPSTLTPTTVELVIDAPQQPGSYELVAFGRLEFVSLLGVIGQSFIANLQVTESDPDPEDPVAIDELLASISGFELPPGPERSLSAPLQAARDQLERDQGEQACGPLGAFLNQVDALEGRRLSTEQADELREGALRLRDELGCDT